MVSVSNLCGTIQTAHHAVEHTQASRGARSFKGDRPLLMRVLTLFQIQVDSIGTHPDGHSPSFRLEHSSGIHQYPAPTTGCT
ncbi:MAG: hypothetical protein R3C11_09920 [Planctomycetaceae bacterium]